MTTKKKPNAEEAQRDKQSPDMQIRANSYFLNFDGELYAEPAQRQIGNQTITMNKPVKLGEVLANPVACGEGLEAKHMYDAVYIGSLLNKRAQKEGDDGVVVLDEEQVDIIKKTINDLKMVNNGQQVDANFNIKVGLLYAVDPSLVEDERVRQLFDELYEDYDSKVAAYEDRANQVEEMIAERQKTAEQQTLN